MFECLSSFIADKFLREGTAIFKIFFCDFSYNCT